MRRKFPVLIAAVALACGSFAHASGSMDENNNIAFDTITSFEDGVSNSIGFGTHVTESNVMDIGGRTLSNISVAVDRFDLVTKGQLDTSVSLLDYRLAVLEGAITEESAGYHGAGSSGDPDSQEANMSSQMYSMAGFGGSGGSGSGDVSHDYVDDLFQDAVSQSMGYTDRSVRELEGKISAGIAASAAQPVMPGLSVGEKAVAIGSGHYNGKNAIGIAAGFSPKEYVIISAGISASDTAGQSVFNTSISRRF